MNLSSMAVAAAAAVAASFMLAGIMPDTRNVIRPASPSAPVAYTDLRRRSAAVSPLFAECFEGELTGSGLRFRARRLPWPPPAGNDADRDEEHDHVDGIVDPASQVAYTSSEPASGRCADLSP